MESTTCDTDPTTASLDISRWRGDTILDHFEYSSSDKSDDEVLELISGLRRRRTCSSASSSSDQDRHILSQCGRQDEKKNVRCQKNGTHRSDRDENNCVAFRNEPGKKEPRIPKSVSFLFEGDESSSNEGRHTIRGTDGGAYQQDRGNSIRAKMPQFDNANESNTWLRVWGGQFLFTMHEATLPCEDAGNDHRLSQFFEIISVGGLRQAFDSHNSPFRTVFWLIAFIVFGVFFVKTTVPLIESFRTRSVLTAIDTVSGEEGLPFPIVTVCPIGSGINCKCSLWRRLHCRYRYEVLNYDWMARFDVYGCWDQFDHENLINGSHPTWTKPNCEHGQESAHFLDPCIPPMNKFKGRYDMEQIYERVLERENTQQGPHITLDELIIYGSKKVKGNVFFMDSNLNNALPEEWIQYDIYDWSRLQSCAQIRPPNSKKGALQRVPGANNGIAVVMTKLSSHDYSLYDFWDSSASVQVHVHLNQGSELNFNDTLTLPNKDFFHVDAATETFYEYESTTFSRHQGWGPLSSQTCDPLALPRDVCTFNTMMRDAAQNCSCIKLAVEDYGVSVPSFFGCAHNPGTLQRQCLDDQIRLASQSNPDFGTCPEQCEETVARVIKNTAVKISEGQLLYLRNILKVPLMTHTNTAILRLGLGSMEIEVTQEFPSTSFPELTGEIGGNIGLWCGLSLLTIVEVTEFLIVLIFYSKRLLIKRRRA